jgi:hypothetical protein
MYKKLLSTRCKYFSNRIIVGVEGVCDCAVYEYWKCVENRGCYAHAANMLLQPHRRGGSNLRFVCSENAEPITRPTLERNQT